MAAGPSQSHDLDEDITQSSPPQNPLFYLGPNSYTVRRLQHATPEHLHLTTRRCFIGPIPEGWLRSHRRDWYRHHLHIHYSSRSATFNAAANTGKHRRLTGLSPSESSKSKSKREATQAKPGQSFPQPQDVEDAVVQDGEGDGGAKDSVDIPRAEESVGVIPAKDIGAVQNEDDPGKSKRTEDDGPDIPRQDSDRREGSTRSARTTATSGMRTWKSAKSKLSRADSNTSFVTAQETPVGEKVTSGQDRAPFHQVIMDGQADDSDANRASTVGSESRTDSTAALLPKDQAVSGLAEATPSQSNQVAPTSDTLQKSNTPEQTESPLDAPDTKMDKPKPKTGTGLVRFNLPEDGESKDQIVKVRLAQHRRRDTFKRLRKGKAPEGEIIKMEKMLVRVEYTASEVIEDYDENESQKVDSRVMDKWREFMVVCRESTTDDTDYVLQMYKSRVIPATEKTHVRKRFAHELTLDSKSTHINLFSSLDKTIVMWEPYRHGTRLYIMKPRSGASAMEWFTFLRGLLGWDRPSILQVNVPDLDVSLRVDKPFGDVESSQDLVKAAEGDQEALAKTVHEEHAAAENLVARCMEMLEKSPDWGEVVAEWALPTEHGRELSATPAVSRVVTAHQGDAEDRPVTASSTAVSTRSTMSQMNGHRPVGLAWKRYDRLEWVHGANEKSMYGSIGMEKFHDLELRPKQHYPTSTRSHDGEQLTEPPPVEGFLVRLTSQKGAEQKMGKLFYKRLYFSTHSQYLVFNRPGQADPPPPPSMPLKEGTSEVPGAHEIAEKVPLIFAVNPFPLQDSQISWLNVDDEVRSEDEVREHDENAFDEDERKINLLLKCDGLINLTQVTSVRNIRRGATPADRNVEDGPEVDFHDQEEDDDTRHEDGTTNQLDDERTFEVVLKNGLVIRLQAFNKFTRREWQVRLRALIEYWTLRCAADLSLFKSVRRQNLDVLKIDEEQEAYVGQFAHKWEVSQAVASPQLYHMCGIGCCRTVMLSGQLFRKPRMHASFSRVNVVLAHGHLMVFQDAVRSRTGKLEKHIHHERVTAINLEQCYIYSGLITSSDLLYSASDGYEKARAGHEGGLPRMYIADGWSSTDEDTMTCFVLWHGKRKSWFKSDSGDGGGRGQRATGKIKRVAQLGKEGRSVVFKARSRAERDHWVMSVGMEIERLAQSDHVRIVKGK